MFRGEDVADLQSRLNGLGFDSGKVDGIFGPDTETAVVEFQHNRGLAEDGKVGPDVVTEIRLVTRGTLQRGREAVREAEWLRRLPPTLVGSRIYFDAGCRSPEESLSTWDAASAAALELQERGGIPVLSRSQDTMLPARVRARRANRMGADIIVAFQTHDIESDGVFFFQTSHSTSHAGELLAKAISKVIGGPMAGRATALLRETRAPAVVVSRTVLDPNMGRAVVDGIELFFAEAGDQPMKDR
jgi:N-acetylmuramoyl-L-alanine amidase